MTQIIDRSPEISRAIRNLVLGRVLLKKDCPPGQTFIPLGNYDTNLPLSEPIPGSFLFQDQQQAVLVEPGPRPDEVIHSEIVTITSTASADLIIYPPNEHQYSVAGGAYVALVNPPVPGLRVVTTDPEVLPPDAIDARWFPCVSVARLSFSATPRPSAAYEVYYRFQVRYARLWQDDADCGDKLMEDTARLVNLFFEDPYLGGAAEDSTVANAGLPRFRRASQNAIMLISDVVLDVRRTEAYTKL